MAKAKDKPDEVPEDDRFDLMADGSVLVTLDGERRRLRRPKVGEYRKLRERLWDLQDDKVSITERHRDQAKERAEELKGATEVEQTMAVRQASRALTAELEALNEQWIREAFDMLGDKAAPEAVDDWPTWLRESDFVTRLVEHWRSVP